MEKNNTNEVQECFNVVNELFLSLKVFATDI